MSKYWSKLRCLKGGVYFERKFQGEGGRPPTNFGFRKTTFPGLSRGVLRDPTFSRFDTIPACDTHTDRQTHVMAITRADLAPRG